MADTQATQVQMNRIDDVKTYIYQHTDQLLNREQLADLVGFSVPHFHRIFSAENGENIATYVRRVRLERAAVKLMMGAVDITEVALEAGYKSHAAFGKAFRQHFGFTPSQFRGLDFQIALQTLSNGKPKNKDKKELPMTTYVLLYTGGTTPETKEEMAAVMEVWQGWIVEMGESIVGGDPFGHAMRVNADGLHAGAGIETPIAGYSVITAESIEEAAEKCVNHPHISFGGQVLVYETFPMGLV